MMRLDMRVLFPVLLALAGCATPAPFQTENIGAIRSGVVAAREQSDVSFALANDLARTQAIERKIRLPERILRQRDFPAAVPDDAIRQWRGTFDILDDYAAALQSLIDPARATATGDAISSLGKSLAAPDIGAKVPGPLVAVFATFGGALMQAAGEKKATDVMRATDPAFADVTAQMATAIGTADAAGSLSNTVASQWNNAVLPLIETDYGMLPASDVDGRRRIARAYLAAMAQRDRQLGDLVLLQRSILAIGEIHAAAARGSPGDALFWIGRINGWVDEVKTRAATAEAGR